MKKRNLMAVAKVPLAIMLLGGVNSAYADLTLQAAGLIQNIPGASTVTPSADLFITIWDQKANDSYSVDLGLNIHTFEADAASTNITWNLDNSFKTFAATGDALTYNVAGVDENISSAGKAVYSNTTNDTVLMSFPTGGSAFSAGGFTGANLSGFENKVAAFINSNSSNSSEIITDTNNGAYFNSSQWGVGQGNSSGIDSAVAGGGGANKLSVIYLNTPGTTIAARNFTSTAMTETLPAGYFSLNAANDTLAWTSNVVTAVPVPGMTWLFLGGVMTLLASQKRKSV
jgi:hypothetical protein